MISVVKWFLEQRKITSLMQSRAVPPFVFIGLVVTALVMLGFGCGVRGRPQPPLEPPPIGDGISNYEKSLTSDPKSKEDQKTQKRK
ncbi:MAG: hypothetical protein NZ480_03665 [Bdellovibrionaceae bacterium]|nr:hypothetical protein [Pseudobdellovibrionaceae bacterium]MDW8189467.1 hypothetical protein [Pseudobdellovibrionaceae bacterium]